MGTIEVIIMIILFIVLMVFVFSTALLTPIIGKKNLIFVILMGFIAGIIGGAFFISPIMDDIPGIAASFYQSTSKDLDTVNLDVSTNIDINQFINNVKGTDGVKNVNVSGITVKTSQFSNQWVNTLGNRIPNSNTNITSAQVQGNDTINIQIEGGSDPQTVINKLKDWLMLVGAINLNYSVVHVAIQTEPAKTNQIINQFSQNAVVTNIKGPTQDRINSIKAILPNKSNIIIVCGFIGMLVGLAGLFIDTLLGLFGNIKGRIINDEE